MIRRMVVVSPHVRPVSVLRHGAVHISTAVDLLRKELLARIARSVGALPACYVHARRAYAGIQQYLVPAWVNFTGTGRSFFYRYGMAPSINSVCMYRCGRSMHIIIFYGGTQVLQYRPYGAFRSSY